MDGLPIGCHASIRSSGFYLIGHPVFDLIALPRILIPPVQGQEWYSSVIRIVDKVVMNIGCMDDNMH